MRHYLWKTVRFDVPLKTVYAWYRPHKREAINRNGRSPRICSASPQEAMSRQRGGVGALPAMRHATFRQTSPQNGPRIPTREHQHPVQRFLEQTSAGRDTSIRYVSKCIVQLCLTTDTPDVLKAVRGGGDTQSGDLPHKTLLKPDAVARFLGVSSNTVYRWYHFGLIEGVKANGILRIYRDSVLKLVEEKGLIRHR